MFHTLVVIPFVKRGSKSYSQTQVIVSLCSILGGVTVPLKFNIQALAPHPEIM